MAGGKRRGSGHSHTCLSLPLFLLFSHTLLESASAIQKEMNVFPSETGHTLGQDTQDFYLPHDFFLFFFALINKCTVLTFGRWALAGGGGW